MLKINEWPRASGKSTQVQNIMRDNPKVMLITPTKQMGVHYPKEFQGRLLNANRPGFLGDVQFHHSIGKSFVFDEGLIQNAASLARMYYEFGRMGIKIEVFGSDMAMNYRNDVSDS